MKKKSKYNEALKKSFEFIFDYSVEAGSGSTRRADEANEKLLTNLPSVMKKVEPLQHLSQASAAQRIAAGAVAEAIIDNLNLSIRGFIEFFSGTLIAYEDAVNKELNVAMQSENSTRTQLAKLKKAKNAIHSFLCLQQ